MINLKIGLNIEKACMFLIEYREAGNREKVIYSRLFKKIHRILDDADRY